jgi:hypothetical protein
MLDSGRYARDYDEITAIGSKTSTTRTTEQTEIARFWLAAPGVLWNAVARQIIAARDLDSSDAARTFALLYLAGADASIACWDAKYEFNFWRPQAAIQNGGSDGNDATAPDGTWEPLFPTPPHPDYLSGHSATSGAWSRSLQLLFGNDGVPFSATFNNALTRHFSSFSQAATEIENARIWAGIHTRTADEHATALGRQVAELAVQRGMPKLP